MSKVDDVGACRPIAPNPPSLISSPEDAISQTSSVFSQYSATVTRRYSNFLSESLSPDQSRTDPAFLDWLNLLATDAAQADGRFSLMSNSSSSTIVVRDDSRSLSGKPDFQTPATEAVSDETTPEHREWQLEHEITLTEPEALLFRHFAEKAASWVSGNSRFVATCCVPV